MTKNKGLVSLCQVCLTCMDFRLNTTDVTTESLFCPFEETQQQIVNGSMKGRSLNMDEYPPSRRKCFHFIWRVTSIRWGWERPNVKRGRTGWHLIDGDLWTHGSNTTWTHALTHCTPASSSYSLFAFFSVSFILLFVSQATMFSKSSSSGEAALKHCATLAASAAADIETNPFMLPSTFRWGGGQFLQFSPNCFHMRMFLLHVLISAT